MLSPERKHNIRQRVEPIIRKLDPALRLIEILLDSTRQYLAFVVQREEQPIILRIEWLLYVRMTDAELQDSLKQQLTAAQAAR